MKRFGKITHNTRLFLQRQNAAYRAKAFGAVIPKPEDRMKFFNRRGLGQGK